MTLGRVLLKVHKTLPIYAARIDGLASGRGFKGGGDGVVLDWPAPRVRKAIVQTI